MEEGSGEESEGLEVVFFLCIIHLESWRRRRRKEKKREVKKDIRERENGVRKIRYEEEE